MKTLILTLNNLKRFIRNWESVLLLVGFPLLIVATIFASFSPDKVNVPLGTVDNTQNFDYRHFKNSSSSFANIKQYNTLEDCVNDVKSFEVYGCALIDKVEGKDQYKLDIYYDNTKEVIDKTILGGVQGVASEMQIQYSRERASTALNELEALNNDIEKAREGLKETDQDLKAEIIEIDKKIKSLEQTRSKLSRKLRKMDEEVNQTENTVEELKEDRQIFYNNTTEKISKIDNALVIANKSTDKNIEELNEAQETVESLNKSLRNYNREVNREIENVNSLIENYRDFRSESRRHMREINETIRELRDTKSKLISYRKEINRTDNKLSEMESRYSTASSKSPEEVANFILTNEQKIYNPETAGSNLIVLQTIYSTLLLLVSLFVSILISKFVTLNEINSGAKRRLEVTPRTFMPEYLSVYTTSLVIASIPVLCVLLFGQHFFKLNILENIGLAGLILFLFSSSMINLGIGSAHLIRNKSITLLVGSFLIVFLIFFSGFILPIEMMSTLPQTIASLMPGNLAQEAFDATVLFGRSFETAKSQILMLTLWNVTMAAIALIIKKKRDM